FDALASQIGVHEEMDDLRISPKTRAVGVVRSQEDSPRIVDEQKELQADRPLYGIDEVTALVSVGNDAAAGFILNVDVAPFAARELVEQVLPRTVGGDCYGIAEEDCSGVTGEAGMSIEIVGDLSGLRAHGLPIVAAVCMELQVSHVSAGAFQNLHGLE